MPKTEIKKIIRNYAKILRAKNFPISAIYLFGSQVNG